jgi:hypothetical protein
MTRKLEELFGFDDLEKASVENPPQTVEETKTTIANIDLAIDKLTKHFRRFVD